MRASLRIVERGGAEATIGLEGPVFRIGSAPDCQYRPRDASVAGRHCELLVRGDEVSVRDLGSVVGTLLNGLRIIPECRARARAGDRIQVGDTILEIAAGGPAGPADSPDLTSAATRLLQRRLGRSEHEAAASMREDLAMSHLEGVPIAAVLLRRIVSFQAVARWRAMLGGLASRLGSSRLILDLRSVEAVSVEAAEALLAFRERARRQGGALKLCEVRPEVLDVLEASWSSEPIPTFLDATMATWSAW